MAYLLLLCVIFVKRFYPLYNQSLFGQTATTQSNSIFGTAQPTVQSNTFGTGAFGATNNTFGNAGQAVCELVCI